MTSPGFGHLRPQQFHHIGYFRRIQLGKERHPRNHAPGDDKIAAMNLFGKGGGDDADWQRHHDEAGEDRPGRDQLAERGHRNHVAIADRADGDDRPPQRFRDRAKFLGLDLALREMHQRGGNERAAKRDHQASEQRATFVVEHVQERTHGRRIARDLEEAHHAKHQHETEIRRQHHREPERQHRDEVDDAGSAQRIFQYAPAWAANAGGGRAQLRTKAASRIRT